MMKIKFIISPQLRKVFLLMLPQVTQSVPLNAAQMSPDFAQLFCFLIKQKFMKEGYVIRDQTLPHFITITVVDWIDVFTSSAKSPDFAKY